MKLDRDKFWELYHEKFGGEGIAQPTVDGLNYFLDRFETETRLKTIPDFAYVSATAYHESGKVQTIGGKRVMVRFRPVSETRESVNSPRRANQDRYWKTGFYGRGFPQTTHESNYLKSGEALGLGDLFVKTPDLLLEAPYAYDAMVICMVKGLYTGKKLSDYLRVSPPNYEGARHIVNGTDRAELIATYARNFDVIFTASRIDSATTSNTDPQKTLEQAGTLPDTAGTSSPESPKAAAVVEVPQIVAQKEDKVDATISKWSARWVAIPATVLTFFSGVGSWLTNSPVHITLALIGAGTLIACLYFGIRQLAAWAKESRELKLTEARESRAFELQKLLVQAGASKDQNTVVITPPVIPIPNSSPLEPEAAA